VLNYTNLFSDLEALFRSAGRDPRSFRRLLNEVRRAGDDLREYYDEVARDYVLRLEARLANEGAALTQKEADLLRAYLGLPPEDAERDQQMLADLERVEECVQAMLRLKGQPLNLRSLDGLRRLLDRLEDLLPRIIDALEERERIRAFEAALGDGGEGMDREALLRQLRTALEAAEEQAYVSSEELPRFEG